MNGARKYAELFEATRQHGRLLMVPGHHARGRTFHVFVLPAGYSYPGKGAWNIQDAVEVYGITGGIPGWTEIYGWLHHGPWEDDFHRVVDPLLLQQKQAEAIRHAEEASDKEARDSRVSKLLAGYSTKTEAS